MKSFILMSLLWTQYLYAYESENSIQALIVGKLVKYITWKKETPLYFKITVLSNDLGKLFQDIYKDKIIKGHVVKIINIKNIDAIAQTEILFISQTNNEDLKNIFKYIEHKNILTVSNQRGFTQKGGMVQLYFHGQKIKIKMNIKKMQEEGFKVDRTLLRIVKIIKKEEKNEN